MAKDFDYNFIQNDIADFLTKNNGFEIDNSVVFDNALVLKSDNNKFDKVIIVNSNIKESINIKELINENSKYMIINVSKKENFSETNKENVLNIVVNKKNYKIKVSNYFMKKNNQNEEDFSEDPILSIMQSKMPLDVKEFISKSKQKTFVLTWIFSILFIGLPAICCGYSFMNSQLTSFGDTTISLFFGGTNYSLTLLGGQWWRIFTYGFGISSSNLIIVGIMLIFGAKILIQNLKYSELKIGWFKFIISFIAGYVISGIFLTIMKFGMSTSGIMTIFGLSLGIMGASISGEETSIANFIKSKMIFPIIYVILVSFLSGNYYLLIDVIVGMASSASILMIINKKIANWDLTFIIPIVILITLICLPVIMFYTNHFLPAPDAGTIYSMSLYSVLIKQQELNFDSSDYIKLEYATSMIRKIGWENYQIFAEKIGDVTMIVIT